ncbi:hypothetical protein NC653_024930 [Populus alba x Populus x berolinensis]|uniref:Transmembrane protein n=1 Tax=Populus alba x Populus x berolinensis TaxID=444605 RepID=A0AAD6M9Y9_9ROSI|nr:hypothetical protein NC653_024930 [Populus alba x Populus x berolinensis]
MGGIAGCSTKKQEHNLDLSFLWGPLHLLFALSLSVCFSFFQDFEDKFVVIEGGLRRVRW